MKARTAKTMFGAALLAIALPAHAETYVAKVFSVPPGYTSCSVNGAGDNGVMTGAGRATDGFDKALFLTPVGNKNLHPAGWEASTIQDSWGGYSAGYGNRPLDLDHALYWIGGGGPADLHPGLPFVASRAFGGGGQLQVGMVVNSNMTTTACSWSRTASSNKRLSSPEHFNTQAFGTNGTFIVGQGVEIRTTDTHALMWHNFASEAVSLSPAGYVDSAAVSADGIQQAGYVSGPTTNGNRHAALWYGSAASFVDLNPVGVFSQSQVNRVRGGLQVGSGTPITTPTRTQAIAWHNQASTWINLHARLPGAFLFWSSTANDIDNQGNIVGTLTSPDGTQQRPVMWMRQ